MKGSTPPAAPAALLPLVDQIARVVHSTWPMPHGLDHEDLVAEGTLGLVQACRRYSADHGCSLSTFAKYRIRGAMIDALRRRYSEVNREIQLGDQVAPGTYVLAEDVVPYGDILRERVSALSGPDRLVLLGRLEGDTFEELGRQLGTDRVQAFRRHRRVLARLRTQITGWRSQRGTHGGATA